MRASLRISLVGLFLLGCGPTTDPSLDGAVPDTGPTSCVPRTSPDPGALRLISGLVIARDGTLYFAAEGSGPMTPGQIGRISPDGTVDATWVTGLPPITSPGCGLALDATNTTLFVCVDETGGPGIEAVDVATHAMRIVEIEPGGRPIVSMTVGPDGMLYDVVWHADTGDVYRIDPAGGAPTLVTTSVFDGAGGIAFEPRGTLLVACGSSVLRLTLSAGLETMRAEVGAFPNGGLNGIAVDAAGHIYGWMNVGERVQRMDADGANVVMVGEAIGAGYRMSMDFGHGALCANDLYLAHSGIVRIAADAPGAAVPWH